MFLICCGIDTQLKYTRVGVADQNVTLHNFSQGTFFISLDNCTGKAY